MAAASTMVAIGMGGLSLVNSYNESIALSEQAKQEELNGRLNAQVMRKNADLVEQSAGDEAKKLQKKGNQFVGAQKAALAGNGVVVNYGSARELQESTMAEIDNDVARIRNNATLEAFGLKAKASSMELQGRITAAGLRKRSGATMVNGVLQAGAWAYKGLGKIKVPGEVREITGEGETLDAKNFGNYEDMA